jgi:indole-3-pyruvate monooxygenase
MTEMSTTAPVLIIGAGPAGLAVGACLKRSGIASIVLERSDDVGSSWRHHYERLHLHTDRRNSALPFIPFPPETPRYASRDQVVAYLERYAARVGLDIRFGQTVTDARRVGNRWHVTTEAAEFESSSLVVATGNARVPFIPEWPGLEAFAGPVLHSSAYLNGTQFRGQRVLVVGFGNSGGEIAIDLTESGARAALSVRSAVNVIPKEVLGVPILTIAIAQQRMPPAVADAVNKPVLRATVGDITKYGLEKLPYGPATQISKDKHIPLIDIGTMALIKSGAIRVHPGIESFTPTGVRFVDGTEAEFDAVVFATGYRARVDEFLDAPAVLDGNGTPVTSGDLTGIPGLYFCGYFVAPTGMLREMGIEAKRIVAAIAGQTAS